MDPTHGRADRAPARDRHDRRRGRSRDGAAAPADHAPLADSLASEVSAAEEAFCTREQRGRWSCDVVDESGQRLAAYDVDAASRSCWRATRTTHRPDGPATAGRCLD